jgi:periplasmic protein TonB
VRKTLVAAALAAAFIVPAAAQTGQAYKIGQDGVRAPVLIKEVKPVYTENAKARGVQGIVEVIAIIKSDGTVAEDVRVTKSLDPDLDEQAIIATRQWKFRPGTKDGKAVDVEVNIELSFTLK